MDRRFNKSNFTVDNNRLKIKTNKDVQNTKPTKGPVTAKLLIHPLSSSSSLSSISKQVNTFSSFIALSTSFLHSFILLFSHLLTVWRRKYYTEAETQHR